jgi:hypothetical protein
LRLWRSAAANLRAALVAPDPIRPFCSTLGLIFCLWPAGVNVLESAVYLPLCTPYVHNIW